MSLFSLRFGSIYQLTIPSTLNPNPNPKSKSKWGNPPPPSLEENIQATTQLFASSELTKPALIFPTATSSTADHYKLWVLTDKDAKQFQQRFMPKQDETPSRETKVALDEALPKDISPEQQFDIQTKEDLDTFLHETLLPEIKLDESTLTSAKKWLGKSIDFLKELNKNSKD